MHIAVKYLIIHYFADDTNLISSSKNPKLLMKHTNEELKLLFG